MQRKAFTQMLGLLCGLATGRAFAQPVVPAPLAEPNATPAPQPAPPAAPAAEPAQPTPTPPEPAPPAAPSVAETSSAAELAELRERVAKQEERLQELQDAHEEAALAAMEAAEDHSQPQKLSIYGFMDMGFQRIWMKEDTPLSNLLNANAGTFVIGNLNVYFDAQPVRSWRGLLEVRFTNAPHGEIEGVGGLGGTFRRTSTQQVDPHSSGINAQMWGGYTVIERAHIDWMYRQEFNVRVGNYFTPWGIWNADHGSPTLISTSTPQLILQRLFPIRQTGLQVYGSTMAGPWELGYIATFSNGRQELANFDFDDDKAVGGRVFARNDGDLRSMFGLSFYWGDNNDEIINLTAVQPTLTFETTQSLRSKEWAAGADISLDIGSSRIRVEGAVQRIKYDRGKRPPTTFVLGAYVPDSYSSTAYFIWAHRLPWGGLEPLIFSELIHAPFSGTSDTITSLALGLNVHFTPATQLKMQVARGFLFNVREDRPTDPSEQNLTTFFSRLVLAY